MSYDLSAYSDESHGSVGRQTDPEPEPWIDVLRETFDGSFEADPLDDRGTAASMLDSLRSCRRRVSLVESWPSAVFGGAVVAAVGTALRLI